MSRLPRYGTAISALALASIVGGCAMPFSRVSSATASKEIGLAVRAQASIAAGDFNSAVHYAEGAVESTPDDALLRTLLGNAYFGAGRFASAEAAYRDSLTLAPNQPKLALKLALVQIAQGKNGEAMAQLNGARRFLDAADYGLAVALAGQPSEAIAVLEPAARGLNADGRIRQNLALAYALSGDWMAARTIAAQDLTPDLVERRVQQWMQMATPARPSDQVAALIGVVPAAVDPGQPVRLALNAQDQRMAALVPAAPVVAPQPVAASPAPAYVPPMRSQPTTEAAAEPAPVVAEPEPAPVVAQAEPAPVVAEPQPAPVVAQAEPAPVVAQAEPDLRLPSEQVAPPVQLASATPLNFGTNVDPVALSAMRIEAPVAAIPAAAPADPVEIRPAAAPAPEKKETVGVVVQLGAYSAPERVEVAWEQIADRYDSVRDYVPTSARFDSDRGTVYRLSVKGFASIREASALCSSLKSKGKTCFVRRVAGDAPVQFAAR